jgi:hypothetical protein
MRFNSFLAIRTIALVFGIVLLSALKVISKAGSLRTATQELSINMQRSWALRLLVMPVFLSVSPLESVSGIRPT